MGTIYSSSIEASVKRNYNLPLLLGNDIIGISNVLSGLTVEATQKVDMLFTQSVSF